MLVGLKLLLPLPGPLSNLLPAATVVRLAASALEEDGLVFRFGLVRFAASMLSFARRTLGGASAMPPLRAQDWG
jgi:hypothetical protein